MCKYVNLHTHTSYSILDGYGLPEKMVNRALALNQPALAVTDHGSMSGLLSTKKVCDDLGVNLLPGCEFYIAPFGHDVHWRPENKGRAGTAYHLTVWAYNQTGYTNLLKLTEYAGKVGFYYTPRIDHDRLEQYNEGLVITSGCMASYACRTLNASERNVTARDYRKVNEYFDWAMDVFGRDRFYIELQDHDIPELRDINSELAAINRHYNFQYLATNDSHYAEPEDARGQAETMAVGQRCTIINPSSFVQGYLDHPSYFMTDYQQMVAKDYGFNVPDSAFTNTVVVADMLEKIYFGYEDEVKKYRFPVMPEYKHDYDGELEQRVRLGFIKRYGDLLPGDQFYQESIDRVGHELSVVKTLGFASYFLCIYDIKMFCDKDEIPMTVRGSAGGSIILYCLGITDFCPLEYNLIFERFLNQDRISAPDADLDIDPAKRAELIHYIMDKYGDDFVAQVVTFSFIKGRSAVRDAARILEKPIAVAEAIISRISDYPNVTIKKTIDKNSDMHVPNLALSRDEKEVVSLAMRLEGQIRHTGIHAGAVMVSDRPLVCDYPMALNRKGITPLAVAVDYNQAEELGGIKIDVLGVEALGILYQAMRIINERHGTKYRFDTVPVDNPISYEVINSGRLSEIFQLTGHTARIVTKQIRPQTVEDIMAINALARPGPLQYAQTFADRMHGKAKVEYRHPDLEQVLAETQGVCIYQEQAMRISRLIAGFSGGEADSFRKAISKKKGIEKILAKFRSGALEKGYDEEFIEGLIDDLVSFGQYAFNASHACAYSRIAAKLAYLKGKYPIEFYAAAMTGRSHQEEKLIGIISECKAYGIEIRPPKLGQSHATDFTIGYLNDTIIFPFGSIKNVGRSANRLSKLDITTINSLNSTQLQALKKIGKRPLESLAMVGALDHLFNNRNEAVIAVPYLAKGLEPVKQMALIEDEDYLYSEADFLAAERSLTGLYLTGHPLEKYNLNQPKFSDEQAFVDLIGDYVMVTGVVREVRLHRDSKHELMAFVSIEDTDYTSLSVVVFSSLYASVHERLTVGQVVRVLSAVQKSQKEKYGKFSIIAQNVIGE